LNAVCSVLSQEVDGEMVSNAASNTKLALGIMPLIVSDLENVNSASFSSSFQIIVFVETVAIYPN
jgi:hypothetical protein